MREFAVELAHDAIALIGGARPSPLAADTKADQGDWVTPFDRAVELETRARIAARYPSHGFVGEEFGQDDRLPRDEAPIVWHLDPIDGTMNFVHGLPWVAFSLAAVAPSGVVAGVVADVYRREIFSATRGGGAWLGDARVRCAEPKSLAGGVFLTEWSGQAPWPNMYDYLDRIASVPAATRIMGSCALALALVGAGRVTGTVLPGRYNSWDVYAGALIAREGGAVLYGRNGPHDGVPMDGVLASPPDTARSLWQAWTASVP
jgi:myo-inositol-1(or 4)-monophosphatase